MELAQVNRDKNIILTSVRIDEVIFNAIHIVETSSLMLGKAAFAAGPVERAPEDVEAQRKKYDAE